MKEPPATVRLPRSTLAALSLCAVASAALAQGYTVTPATGKAEAQAASAVRLDLHSNGPRRPAVTVALPFAFRIYGVAISRVTVGVDGWLVPGDAPPALDTFAPSMRGGHDEHADAFPFGGDLDGIVAPLWTAFTHVADGTEGAGAVWTWTTGQAPSRRFVVSWENVAVAANPRVTVQVQLFEGTDRIVFAYRTAPVTGSTPGRGPCVVGVDEWGGKRFTAPVSSRADVAGVPPSDFVLDPRTVRCNDARAPKTGRDVVWEDIKRESLSADDSARACCYVAKGQGWFWTEDRSFDGLTPKAAATRRAALAAEDRALCGGKGDEQRWVRQVMDAKATLVLRDGAEPVRFWFRVAEYFEVDEAGMSGPDDHVWNLRKMLERVFGKDDPRSVIENYVAWRAAAKGRLTVVKLFDAVQRDDAGPQYTSNRKNEYVLWSARYRAAPRGGALPDHDCPEGWTRLSMNDDAPDKQMVHHADRQDLREVVDPNYVDGGWEYVIRSDDPTGWVSRARNRLPSMREESIDDEK